MSMELAACSGAEIFDGEQMFPNHALLVEQGIIRAIVPDSDIPGRAARIVLDGGILAPGFVDLQVNGGGGVMFNDNPDVATLRIMADAHRNLGTAAFLPTLITATPARVAVAIDAVAAAIEAGVTGIAGLHLEGPHLSLARKGAHDGTLIRPMEPADLDILLQAAERLPALMITIAPENVTPEQVRSLADAGVVVSLGHSDAGFETCMRYADAGARCVTHLFNAMSQLQSRAPGLVGAALQSDVLSAGLIVDGIHVHPAAMALALRAKRTGSGAMFLVTDAMALAGTDADRFMLGGREVRRRSGRLTLPDGTLAGADLDMCTAVRRLVRELDVPVGEALAMATALPASLIGHSDHLGRLVPGARAHVIHLDRDFGAVSFLDT